MSTLNRYLIIDGYSKASRDALKAAGMQTAWNLYVNLLKQHVTDAEYDILLPSDPGVTMPTSEELTAYAGILWTGCNLCVMDTDNPSVAAQIELAKRAYEVGIPSFGSCWGLQISAVAAGGKVIENPKGREMGIARKIILTQEGMDHPMYDGKAPVFDAFISHDDMVSEVPPGGTVLAGNDFTHIQSLSVTHKKGTFWSVQYHPEYDLNEMASLIVAREEKLTNLGFYKGHDDLQFMVDRMRLLHAEQDRKDLRWQLAIDDDILDDTVRQCEFGNWIENLVKPSLES
jgi:GMP synthase (glutamine-hydrolysing)